MRSLLYASLTASILLLAPCLAKAQLSYTLTPSNVVITPGGTITVSGTITNTGTDALYLNGVDEHFVAAPGASGFAIDDTAFFTDIVFPLNGAPLGAGDSVSGTLFDLTATGAPAGDYTLLFTVLGGINSLDTDALLPTGAPASQNFGIAVPVSAVPEPGAVAVLAGLVTTGGILQFKRRNRRA